MGNTLQLKRDYFVISFYVIPHRQLFPYGTCNLMFHSKALLVVMLYNMAGYLKGLRSGIPISIPDACLPLPLAVVVDIMFNHHDIEMSDVSKPFGQS